MIKLYEPRIEDLWFKEKMLSDDKTMSYNHAYGGTIPFPKRYWTGWYNKWIKNHNGRRFYRYIKYEDTFVGEVAYHFDEEKEVYIADVIIYAPYRGNGYGYKGLMLLCESAKTNGINEIYDYIAIDNPSIELFLRCGFKEVLRTNEYIFIKKDL